MSTATLEPAAENKTPPKMPDMPPPAREHAWLEQFAGEWDTEAEITCQPDQPSMICKGTETARLLGGFWLIAQGRGELPGMIFESVLTIGYDEARGKYVGSWVDSMTAHLWKYEGTVNAAGTILTLDTEGPCPQTPGEFSKFKEVTEFKSRDHRIFTSSIQGKDGTWSTMITVHYRRRK